MKMKEFTVIASDYGGTFTVRRPAWYPPWLYDLEGLLIAMVLVVVVSVSLFFFTGAFHGSPDFHGCNPHGENYGPTQEKLDDWAKHPEHDPRIN